MLDAAESRAARLAEVDEAARTRKVPTSLLARWEAALDDISRWKFAPAVVHGDLAPENVLTGNGQVISVLNWSNAHIGDPAIDLAWLYSAAPEASLDTLEEAYAIGRHERPDPHISDRAILYTGIGSGSLASPWGEDRFLGDRGGRRANAHGSRRAGECAALPRRFLQRVGR